MASSFGDSLVQRLKAFSDALQNGESISERFTCRTIRLNLRPTQYAAGDVKQVRGLLGASQAIFAQFLGVSPSTVRDWEQGKKPPRQIACRVMDEIRADPTHWRKRFLSLVEPLAE